ncbi:hypothetical protein [Arthrobacter flavus]|uniref:Lipoprotein n=1 Tax=Arthrobacter flavus TaxID=95172 RepID=A0ABW4Q7P6_9MICC
MGTLIGLAAVTMGACAACTPADASASLPSYDSLESTHQAINELINCVDDAPDSTLVYNEGVLTTTNSIKCTEVVEIFHFDSEESKAGTYSLLAEAEGTVRFAEGKNWFVVDYSDVATVEGVSDRIDVAELAENLDAQYSEVK